MHETAGKPARFQAKRTCGVQQWDASQARLHTSHCLLRGAAQACRRHHQLQHRGPAAQDAAGRQLLGSCRRACHHSSVRRRVALPLLVLPRKSQHGAQALQQLSRLGCTQPRLLQLPQLRHSGRVVDHQKRLWRRQQHAALGLHLMAPLCQARHTQQHPAELAAAGGEERAAAQDLSGRVGAW